MSLLIWMMSSSLVSLIYLNQSTWLPTVSCPRLYSQCPLWEQSTWSLVSCPRLFSQFPPGRLVRIVRVPVFDLKLVFALCENSPHGYWQEKYHSPLSAFNETSPGKVPVSCPQLLPTRSVCMITDFSSILCRILCRLLTRPGNKSTKFPLLFPKHFSVPHGKARQYTCKLRITLIVRNKVTWIYLWTSK